MNDNIERLRELDQELPFRLMRREREDNGYELGNEQHNKQGSRRTEVGQVNLGVFAG